MRAFRFKLERILALRKYREREWEIKLAGATGECVQLRRDIEDREARKAGALNYAPDHTTHLYMARLQQEADRKAKELIEAEKRREEVQTEYLVASRDRKVLDKLKEKRSGAYLKEQKVRRLKGLMIQKRNQYSRRVVKVQYLLLMMIL